MAKKVITIKADKQSVYTEVVANWVNAGATVLQCGYAKDYDEDAWWAIAEIDASAKKIPCYIVRRIVYKNSVPESSWQWGDEKEHTLYYDFEMFEGGQHA